MEWLLSGFQSAPACERATVDVYHDVKEHQICDAGANQSETPSKSRRRSDVPQA
jgi:hypothetical protein